MTEKDHDLWLTGDAASDRLLSTDANALLLGMTLDQQVPMEKAFSGPAVIAQRMGGTLDVAKIAAMDTEEFVALCSEKPAIHRFPGSMGKRVQQVCRALVDDYDGDAENIWAGVDDGAEVLKRLKALPGFGDQKAKIFLALLGKQWGITPSGWQRAAGDYGKDGFRSVADITDNSSLQKVRETKKQVKAAAKKAAADKAAQA
ncbi:HhH-GPD-type base excision DNA repair protein [Enemella evansiae]|uniref:HhH-GPD-type base excision DNA repair protein n=1 Tax=Enemella evansiae TaxID=2016499 RepID=UPI000B9784ED|nr:HhH-GPD-type base excision DNA repair protein [Enemella evansiae]OYO15538.1 Fe-S cluster assembly protein HesB [Enemella evansiae]OYO20533.1 Fe-S cluster assembly protein HesB [Enemella evansiae]TDO93065.1 putative HhH-GPD family protein [Enemella evansiae]